ncbi:MAG: manganese efflux pump MntP family protein [Bacilli bacterium]|nr:manganese efflux pump MntP family protein [Bacilli bacterium]
MDTFFTTLIIGISLSMDAFSLALIYGTQSISKKNKIILSIIVGIYHFVMPLLGVFLGNIILKYLVINLSIVVSIIFLFIGIEMIISSIKDDSHDFVVSIFGFLIFGLSVSIDSFTTGIGLNVINNNYLEVSSIFCIVSGSFTYLGLILGNKLGSIFGKLSTIIGGVILIILGIIYFFR